MTMSWMTEQIQVFLTQLHLLILFLSFLVFVLFTYIYKAIK